MELVIIWGSVTLLSLLITAFTVGICWGILIGFIVGIVMFMWRSYMEDCYDEWKIRKYPGDHPYLEWIRCKRAWRNIMNAYNADTYCKLSFDDFQKYFSVNPSRYELNYSCVTFESCDGDNKYIVMVFPRKDLFKFFEFRRSYLQSRRMVNVVNTVQRDIDKMREDAQEQIDKAKAMLSTDFKIE